MTPYTEDQKTVSGVVSVNPTMDFCYGFWYSDPRLLTVVDHDLSVRVFISISAVYKQ